jgi:antitoxin component of MazEF toxin-antitoxin module
MDDHKKTLATLSAGKVTDITAKEFQALEKYKEAGLPSITSISDVGLTKALEMYMSGKTYHEIAKIIGTKKEIILYYAQKFNWYQTKMEHMEILDANLKERILQANLTNQNFMLQIQQFYLQKIGHKMNKYFATGDDELAAQVYTKDVEMYYKAVDLMNKLTTEKPAPGARGPAVGLNLGDGVSIQKIGENEVVITPKNKTTAEMLAELANLKRAEEKNPKKDTYDILVEESKTTTESEEDNENS